MEKAIVFLQKNIDDILSEMSSIENMGYMTDEFKQKYIKEHKADIAAINKAIIVLTNHIEES